MNEQPAPLRAVIDTNVFISSLINAQGNPFALLSAWLHDRFIVLMADEQRVELERVLTRPRLVARYSLTPIRIAEFWVLVEEGAEIVTSAAEIPLAVRDAKDNHILAAAIGGGASHIVTGDDDLLVLDGDPRLGVLRIVTVRAFLDLLAPPTES